MRDFAFLPVIVVLCLVALRHPWIGVLGWTWLSVMNPHSYTWAAATMPVAAMLAGSTIVGAVITSDRRRVVVTSETALLAIFMLWITITYPFSFNPDGSFAMWSKVMKIDFMILMTIVLLQSRRQIEWLVWVIVFSLGFFGIKGGIFTIVHAGAHRVQGPSGFIEGNNELALALIMVIPLMRFLQLRARTTWVTIAWVVAMTLTATAALGSQSRGAFVGIAAMAAYLWIKSPRKVLFGAGMLVAGAVALGFMSEAWNERMGTIANFEQDGSAMGRINAWWMTWNLAKDNFIGGGFDIYDRMTFARYAPNPKDIHAAHSIYFQVLGEQGFVGIFIWMLMWGFVWRSAAWLVREGRLAEDTHWCRDLGAMCQVSLVGYFVGGAFLSLAYFDLPYLVLAVVVLAKRWLQEHRASASVAAIRPDADGMTRALGPVEHAR